jgi:hypothetical protein
MCWTRLVDASALEWLLEEDENNPSIRYLALKQLQDLPDGDLEVDRARQSAMRVGLIPMILSKQEPQGSWERPRDSYNPKYTSTIWQVILLSQLGVDPGDERVRKGCEFLLANNRTKMGVFSASQAPSGVIHCLQGNLCAALLDLGYREDPRLLNAVDWMARTVTGEGISPTDDKSAPVRYLRSGISGPGLLCAANEHQPCAWGAVKVALAFARLPESRRTPVVQRAIQMCVDFLISVDPATAGYPYPSYTNKTSSSWFKFGFPVFYVTDILQILEALVPLGLAGDARLRNAIDLLVKKQNPDGRWVMEYTYNGKMWVDIETKHQPSKWVTLRALRVLKGYYSA